MEETTPQNEAVNKANSITDFNFRNYAWRQFKKNRPAYISLWVLGLLTLLAVFAPVIANEKPLYMKYKGQSFYPAFSFKSNYELTDPKTGEKESLELEITDWKHLKMESVVWAPVAWSPGKADIPNGRYQSPGSQQVFIESNGDSLFMPSRFRHRLGTNASGEDLLAGLIHGARISLSIGFLSMGIASFIGLLLGAMAGYFGDDRMRTPRLRYWMTILSLPFAWFYAFSLRSYVLADAIANSGLNFVGQLLVSILIFALVIVLFNRLGKWLSRGSVLAKPVTVPVDSFISRGIEILNSIPTQILILSLAALAKEQSIIYVMVIIGLTSWTGIARFTRAEFLKIRNMDYIQAAQAMGFKERRVIFKHALINGMAPSLVSIAFGIAAAILIESGLSFLGIGVPPNIVTWGKLLSQGREHFQSWWLIVFPGIAIFITVTVYNLIGEGLRDALDPKLKQ